LRTHSLGQGFDQAGALQTVSVRATAEADLAAWVTASTKQVLVSSGAGGRWRMVAHAAV